MLELKNLLERLLKNEVEFILIGGFAAVVHGSASLTQDVDVCFPFTPQNIQRLLKALEGTNPRVRAGKGWLPLTEVQRLSEYNNLYVVTDLGMLDLLGEVAGLGTFPGLIDQSELIDLFGKKCRILTIDALIAAKESMDRPKDRQVAFELRAIREKLQK